MLKQQTRVTLGHLDGRLLVDAEKGNVGHADEGPFLVGPEHDDGSSLRGLGRDVKVGEANAPQVGSQADEDVPVREREEFQGTKNAKFESLKTNVLKKAKLFPITVRSYIVIYTFIQCKSPCFWYFAKISFIV